MSTTADPPATATVSIRDDVAQELFDLWHQIRRITAQRFTEEGLSFPRAKALWVLQEQGPVRASGLAGGLECSPATVTELVDGLVRDGLATREPDPSDRRAVLISVSAEGQRVADEARARKRRILGGVLAELSDDDVASLDRLLGQISHSVTSNGVPA